MPDEETPMEPQVPTEEPMPEEAPPEEPMPEEGMPPEEGMSEEQMPADSEEPIPPPDGQQEGGPRIVINPTTFENQKDAMCVAFNEGFRVIMEYMDFRPVSSPTRRQRDYLRNTAYAHDELQLRRTILARIATFDTSVKDPTDEQIDETIEFLDMVLENQVPQNDWETEAVTRIKTVLEHAIGLRDARAQEKEPPPPEDAPEEEPMEEPVPEEEPMEEPVPEEEPIPEPPMEEPVPEEPMEEPPPEEQGAVRAGRARRAMTVESFGPEAVLVDDGPLIAKPLIAKPLIAKPLIAKPLIAKPLIADDDSRGPLEPDGKDDRWARLIVGVGG